MSEAPAVCFSAPSRFLPPEVFAGLPIEVVRREVWHEADLEPHARAVAWVTNTGWSFQLGARHLQGYPNVRVIVTPSTGSDHIRVEELRAAGVTCLSLLDNRPGLEAIAASAEFAFLLLLNGLRNLPLAIEAIERREWRRDREDDLRGRELQGRRVGLVGLGRIGRRLARYCAAFGATVSYFDPYVESASVARVESLTQLFDASESVVICCTYNTETAGMVGRDLLCRLPFGATLVNIARGEIVRERELVEIIGQRPDLQVSLDVLADESLGRQFDSPIIPLVDHRRVLVTPHVGGATSQSQIKAARIALELVVRQLGLSRSLAARPLA